MLNSYFDPFFPLLLAAVAAMAWNCGQKSPKRRSVLLSLTAAVWVYASPWLGLTAETRLQEYYGAAPTARSAPNAQAIVVLAGDGIPPNRYQDRTLLGQHTLVRLEKAHDLAVEMPDLRVIVTGGFLFGADRSITLAGLMRSWLIDHGIPSDRIETYEAETNTYESARNIAKGTCGDGRPIFLVTETVHMPRAAGVFAAQGCKPIAVPCSLYRAGSGNLYHLLPSGRGLSGTQALVHEIGGLVWYWANGRLS